MARTKQTACKSDSKDKFTQATFDQPSTNPDSTSTMDKPKKVPTDTDPRHPAPDCQTPRRRSVDLEAPTQEPAHLPVEAEQEEQEIVQFDIGAEGDTGGKTSPSTSSDTPSTPINCKHKCDKDEDEGSRRYMVQLHAAVEAWKKAVTETEDSNVAKAAYSMLYNALYQGINKTTFFHSHTKTKVLESISKQDGMYMTADDANVWVTKKISEEPEKSVVDRKEE